MALNEHPKLSTTNQIEDLPSVLIVQGSFQSSEVYIQLVKGLEAKGYQVVLPELPTCSHVDRPDFPTKTLIDDALAVRAELGRLIEQEGKIVLMVQHSYGGLVGSEAVIERLSYEKRQALGLPGGVFHLFLYAAFLLDEGQSVLGAYGESPNNDVRPDGRFYLRDGAQKLYHDLPSDEAEKWTARLIPQSYAVQKTELTQEPWRYIPSTYLICEDDQVLPSQFQEIFATKAKSSVEKCNSGHSPHLSQIDMLVRKIDDVTKRALHQINEGKSDFATAAAEQR